jgi:hypothetical protein
MALVSATTLKQYLPEITGTDADTELNALIGRIESFIARFLGFPTADSGNFPVLDSSTYTVYLDGTTGWSSLVLQMTINPVTAITSVHSDPDRVYGSDTLVAASEYELDSVNSRIILKSTATTAFDNAFRAIKVICTAGYSTANPPDDLVHAICIFASMTWRNRNNWSRDSITQRGSTINLSPKQMPLEVRQIIYPLRSSAMLL